MFRPNSNRVRFATDFNDQSAVDEVDADGESELVIPEDLTGLSVEDLTALHTQASEAFDALYQDGEGDYSADDLTALGTLTEGIEALAAEQATRGEAAAERASAAAELAGRVRGDDAGSDSTEELSGDTDSDEGDEDDEDTQDDDGENADADNEEDAANGEKDSVVASGDKRIRLNGLNRRKPTKPKMKGPQVSDLIHAAPDVPGFAAGQGMSSLDLANAVNKRASGFARSSFANGNKAPQKLSIASISKSIPDELILHDDSLAESERVFSLAADETKLKGNSLVASGGWGAPSVQLYDLWEGESRDGIFNAPTVGVTRGGFKYAQPIDFATLYSTFAGFHYSEQNDIDAAYDDGQGATGDNSAGDKPVVHLDAPDFSEVRLDFDGLIITAGLLMRRGYPEQIARLIRGALVAHDHRMSGKVLAAIVDGSDAISMTDIGAGATSPILDALELHAEHTRELHRLPRNSTIEVVFDYWVRGLVRSDLSKRLGVDLFDVTDARINAWFASRGVSAQFVWNFNGIAGTAKTALKAYPTSVSFLMYPAGTWVKGTSEILTLDTIYDSTLLRQNDYTALFTEEGWLVANRGVDSRYITVPVVGNGQTGAEAVTSVVTSA